jgi:hypothetical protein
MKHRKTRGVMSMQDVYAESKQGPHVVNKAIELGHLETFLIGRRRFARPEKFDAWIDFLEAESEAGRPVVYRPRSSERAEA